MKKVLTDILAVARSDGWYSDKDKQDAYNAGLSALAELNKPVKKPTKKKGK